MARKNSKRSRWDSLNQRQQRRLSKAKQNTRKKDSTDWTDRILKIIKEGE